MSYFPFRSQDEHDFCVAISEARRAIKHAQNEIAILINERMTLKKISEKDFFNLLRRQSDVINEAQNTLGKIFDEYIKERHACGRKT